MKSQHRNKAGILELGIKIKIEAKYQEKAKSANQIGAQFC